MKLFDNLELDARTTAAEYVLPFDEVPNIIGYKTVSQWREGPYPRSDYAKKLDPETRAVWDEEVRSRVTYMLERKARGIIRDVLDKAKREYVHNSDGVIPKHILAECLLGEHIATHYIGAAIDGSTSGYGVELRGDQITVKFPLPMFETKGSPWQTYRQPFVLVSRSIPNWYLRATGNMHVRPRNPRQYN